MIVREIIQDLGRGFLPIFTLYCLNVTHKRPSFTALLNTLKDNLDISGTWWAHLSHCGSTVESLWSKSGAHSDTPPIGHAITVWTLYLGVKQYPTTGSVLHKQCTVAEHFKFEQCTLWKLTPAVENF